jgi:hypothetical protein
MRRLPLSTENVPFGAAFFLLRLYSSSSVRDAVAVQAARELRFVRFHNLRGEGAGHTRPLYFARKFLAFRCFEDPPGGLCFHPHSWWPLKLKLEKRCRYPVAALTIEIAKPRLSLQLPAHPSSIPRKAGRQKSLASLPFPDHRYPAGSAHIVPVSFVSRRRQLWLFPAVDSVYHFAPAEA